MMQAFSLTRNTAGHETDLILMSADEDKECKEFYQHFITTKVIYCVQLLKNSKTSIHTYSPTIRISECDSKTVILLLINVYCQCYSSH